MIPVHFVYCPKSGSRVFASAPTSGIVTVRWNNGSLHVAGGVRLTYPAAAPGHWWRDVARKVATAIVTDTRHGGTGPRLGGVAYDEQGTITLIVPEGTAATVDRLMRAAARHALRRVGGGPEHYADASEENAVAILLDGGDIDRDTGAVVGSRGPIARPVPVYGAHVAQTERVRVRIVTQDETGEWDHVGGVASVSAPVAWGSTPTIEGATVLSTADEAEVLAEAIADAHRREDRDAAEWDWIPF